MQYCGVEGKKKRKKNIEKLEQTTISHTHSRKNKCHTAKAKADVWPKKEAIWKNNKKPNLKPFQNH